jgi:hypothetical protein
MRLGRALDTAAPRPLSHYKERSDVQLSTSTEASS